MRVVRACTPRALNSRCGLRRRGAAFATTMTVVVTMLCVIVVKKKSMAHLERKTYHGTRRARLCSRRDLVSPRERQDEGWRSLPNNVRRFSGACRWVTLTWSAEETFDRLEEDREAEGEEEDTVDQCSQNFRAMPSV